MHCLIHAGSGPLPCCGLQPAPVEPAFKPDTWPESPCQGPSPLRQPLGDKGLGGRPIRHFKNSLLMRLSQYRRALTCSLGLTVGRAAVLTHQEIEQQIENLSRSMPRLLQGSQGPEFWIEFMERADAIKDRAPLSLRDAVAEKIHGVLAHYGISPPWRRVRGDTLQSAHVYAFPSGLRLS
jgi:hypothetical protein